MNCHGDNKGKQENHNHSPLKHMLHMAICCGLPILIIGALPLITKFSPGLGGTLAWIAPFLCPLMMIAMMPMMFGDNKKRSCCEDSNENQDGNKPIEINKPLELNKSAETK